MTAEQYLALEYHVNVRLLALVADAKKHNLAPGTAKEWGALTSLAQSILDLEWRSLAEAERLEVERQRRLAREDAEYRAQRRR